jgi:hypothetical protein
MSSTSNVCFKLFYLALKRIVYKGHEDVHIYSVSTVSVGVVILQLVWSI